MISINNLNKGVVKLYTNSIIYNWELPLNIWDTTETTGSGFFIDKDGHILTCSHCVHSSSDVLIQIPCEGSKKYKCKVISINPTLT